MDANQKHADLPCIFLWLSRVSVVLVSRLPIRLLCLYKGHLRQAFAVDSCVLAPSLVWITHHAFAHVPPSAWEQPFRPLCPLLHSCPPRPCSRAPVLRRLPVFGLLSHSFLPPVNIYPHSRVWGVGCGLGRRILKRLLSS